MSDKDSERRALHEMIDGRDAEITQLREYLASRDAALENVAKERGAARAECKRLRAALEIMIYETTHLSREEDDGSHWCKISKAALEQARDAYHRREPHPAPAPSGEPLSAPTAYGIEYSMVAHRINSAIPLSELDEDTRKSVVNVAYAIDNAYRDGRSGNTEYAALFASPPAPADLVERARWIDAAEMPSQSRSWYWAEFPGTWIFYAPKRNAALCIDHGDTRWHSLQSKRYWGPWTTPEAALAAVRDEASRQATEACEEANRLHNGLTGKIKMDAEARAEWVLQQYLDGLTVRQENREGVKEYLTGHFARAEADVRDEASQKANIVIEAAYKIAECRHCRHRLQEGNGHLAQLDFALRKYSRALSNQPQPDTTEGK